MSLLEYPFGTLPYSWPHKWKKERVKMNAGVLFMPKVLSQWNNIV